MMKQNAQVYNTYGVWEKYRTKKGGEIIYLWQSTFLIIIIYFIISRPNNNKKIINIY